MNISIREGGAGMLLALLLLGCSASEGGQPAETGVAVAVSQAAPASSTPTPQAASAASAAVATGSDGSGPMTPAASATSAAPSTAQSTGAPATAGPVQAPAAQPNQVDQAGLADQWEEAAIEVPGTAPALHSGANTQVVPTARHTALGHAHVTPSHPTNMAVATHLHPAPAPALGTQVVATHVAHPAATSVTQSAAAQRRVRLTSLASRFNRPELLSSSDTPAPPPHVMSLKMGNVGISNFDDVARVNFALKASGSDAWANDYIDPRDSREFSCGLAGECQFWMQTGDKSPVYYMMHRDHRYAIFWDQRKAIWDLRLAVQDP